MRPSAAAAAAACAVLCAGGPVADRVAALPGWGEALPSTMYSGYLGVGASKHLHYWLVESERAPEKDPVLLWLNGGPGCSSADGLLYEHGPLLFGEDGALLRNNYTWARVANVLYLEAPAGVGFSYSDRREDYNTGDAQTADDNLAALQSFFAAFPEFDGRDFYISGESYGGVYVPTLADRIANASSLAGSFRGFIVGNGGPGCGEAGRSAHVDFYYGHGIISTALYQQIQQECAGKYDDPPRACRTLLDEMRDCTEGLNVYDGYRDCYHSAADAGASRRTRGGGRVRVGNNDVPCIDSRQAVAYLNRADVQRALHIHSAQVNSGAWTICQDEPFLNYTGGGTDRVSIYQRLAATRRVMVYDGDSDSGAQREAEWCLSSLFDVRKKWARWMYNRTCAPRPDVGETYCQDGPQVGGYVTQYAPRGGEGKGEVRYVTVHGSGHMVPQWKPEAAYKMIDAFLAEEPLA